MRTRHLAGLVSLLTVALGASAVPRAASAQTPGPMMQQYQLTVPIDATGLPPEVRSIGAMCSLQTALASGRSASGTFGNAAGTDVPVVSGAAHGTVTVNLQATIAPAAAYQCLISFYVVTPTWSGTVNSLVIPHVTVPHTGTDIVNGYLTTP
jgi:hypothetical protein